MDDRDYPLTVRVTGDRALILLLEHARAFSSAVKAALEHLPLAPMLPNKNACILKLLVCLAGNLLPLVPAACYLGFVAL